MKIHKDIIVKVKAYTKNNPAANAVFHLLALRERSRHTLNLVALKQSMRKEGFEYTNSDYREVLHALAKAGIATPVINRLGNCVGLKDINVSLPELGRAACQGKEPMRVEPIVATKIPGKSIVKVEVMINGSPTVLQFPKGLNTKELNILLEKLQAG